MAKTVIVIDDDEAIGKVIKRFLEKRGYHCLVFNNPQQALATFSTKTAQIKCVLLDLCLPQMKGEVVMQELHRLKPNVSIILMSGYALEDLDEQPDPDLYLSFLRKPFELNNLADTLSCFLV